MSGALPLEPMPNAPSLLRLMPFLFSPLEEDDEEEAEEASAIPE